MAAAPRKGVTEPSRSAQCRIAADPRRRGYTGTRPRPVCNHPRLIARKQSLEERRNGLHRNLIDDSLQASHGKNGINDTARGIEIPCVNLQPQAMR
jgi:hypothetical protein